MGIDARQTPPPFVGRPSDQRTGQLPAWQRLLLPGLLLLLAILFVVTLVTVYVSQERFFYFYDFAGYQGVAQDLAYAFSQDPLTALSRLKNSLELEYNDLFAIPLVPWILVFGEKRLVYELSAALLYQLPFALTLGAVAHRLISKGSYLSKKSTGDPGQASQPSVSPHHVSHLPQLAFWLTVFLTLAFPIAWAPLLRGLPDVGAAGLVALAVWVYLDDLTLRRPRQIIFIGILLALAVIFRRHFAYAAVAFYLAVFLQFILALFLSLRVERSAKRLSPATIGNRANPTSNFTSLPSSAWNTFWKSSLRLALAAVISLLTILLLTPSFITRLLATDYNSLYTSYLLPWNDLLIFFGKQFGPLIILLASLGFAQGLRSRLLFRDGALFILIFGGAMLTVWTLMAGQGTLHYTLHFTYLVILGISSLFLIILNLSNPAHRLGLVILLTGVVVLNAFSGLFRPFSPPASRLLSAAYPPLVRLDYAEAVRLVTYLHETVPPGSLIYVVDSSFNINADLIEKAERILYGRSQAHLNILHSPIIDSRDNYPLESLLEASYVVLSTPGQYHLKASEQNVVGVTYDIFGQSWEIAQDFELLPEKFQLAGGAANGGTTARVYQRVQPTSEQTAIRTFNKMSEQIGNRPGSQLDWVNLGFQNLGIVQNKAGLFTSIAGSVWPERPVEMSFLYIGELPENGKIVGNVKWNQSACKDLSLETAITTSTGEQVNSNQAVITQPQASFELPFQTTPTDQETSFLLLRANTAKGGSEVDACTVRIRWQLQEK